MNTAQWLWRKYKNKNNLLKESLSSNQPTPPPSDITITKLAVIMDGQVEEVLRAQDRMAALFLSSPQFVEITDENKDVTIGWKYNNGVFEAPINTNIEIEQ